LILSCSLLVCKALSPALAKREFYHWYYLNRVREIPTEADRAEKVREKLMADLWNIHALLSGRRYVRLGRKIILLLDRQCHTEETVSRKSAITILSENERDDKKGQGQRA
jgi:hypothetical protein